MTERACEQTRRQLLDYVRRALAPEEARALEAHVAGCAECASALAEEQTVNELLRTRLPVTKAPDSLQRAVAALAADGRHPRLPHPPEHARERPPRRLRRGQTPSGEQDAHGRR